MLDCTPNTAAKRRYTREFAFAMVLYVLLVFGSIYMIKHGLASSWKYPVALLPILPALLVPRAVVRYFREIDELQRQIQLEALAFSFTLTAILTLSYGFLQNVGLPTENWVWVWPLMGFLWSIGTFIARRRYK